MNTTVLQVPISKVLRADAIAVAKDSGFSSLQEVVRVFLSQFVKKEVAVTFEKYPTVALSAKNDKRYDKMIDNFKKGINVKSFDNADDLMDDLLN
jgi:antitoxin component of RelBE/YafQ-DinJ toxin-antitoxin module